MSELRPCPFCGGVKVDTATGSHGTKVIMCRRCKASARSPGARGLVIAAWNTRQPSPATLELIEAARVLLQYEGRQVLYTSQPDKLTTEEAFKALRQALAAWDAQQGAGDG